MLNTQDSISHLIKGASALLIGVSFLSTVHANEHIVPAMVNIPAGTFILGDNVGPSKIKPAQTHDLNAFQMGKYPITVAEYRLFIESSGYKSSVTCSDYMGASWFNSPDDSSGSASWDTHRFQNNEYQPVTCVTYQDALAYAKWISEKTGTEYRLPTEKEWIYAEKGNTTSRYFWGEDPNNEEACKYGNFADKSGEYHAAEQYGASYIGFIGHANCDDGEAYNSIVGLYRANPFGLFDMVGNISQYLSTCYYEGYEAKPENEMDIEKCEYISHQSETWHFPPQTHTQRGKAKRLDPIPWALMGFRLAAAGHSDNIDVSTKQFEMELKSAQSDRLKNREKLPTEPNNVHLVKADNSNTYLRWQPITDKSVISYDIYQSKTAYAHQLDGYFKKHYAKIKSVPANRSELLVEPSEQGNSYKLVAVTQKLTSLPSQPAIWGKPKYASVPGRVNVQDNAELHNLKLSHRKAREDKPELYYVTKFNSGYIQDNVGFTFNINVEKSGWYNVNYRGQSLINGVFFNLWVNNNNIGQLTYNSDIDDKESNRHKVFLEKGMQSLQLTSVKGDFDYWSFVWLDIQPIL